MKGPLNTLIQIAAVAAALTTLNALSPLARATSGWNSSRSSSVYSIASRSTGTSAHSHKSSTRGLPGHTGTHTLTFHPAKGHTIPNGSRRAKN